MLQMYTLCLPTTKHKSHQQEVKSNCEARAGGKSWQRVKISFWWRWLHKNWHGRKFRDDFSACFQVSTKQQLLVWANPCFSWFQYILNVCSCVYSTRHLDGHRVASGCQVNVIQREAVW